MIEKSNEYTIANANKGYLPQFNINGQGTYQSEVTQIPISLPNVTIEPLSKDQYKIYGEVSQPLTDLFTIRDQKELLKVNARIDVQKTEVDIYKLKDRINNIFFSILLLQDQIEQSNLLRGDIESAVTKTNVAIANGVALKTSADNLNAELLKTDQRIIELQANRKGYIDMLSLFVGRQINVGDIFEMPKPQILSTSQINRPELRLYDLQKNTFDIQSKLISNKTLPKASLFLQGGYGRPALNMLSNDFKTYYIGGVRFSWNLNSYYTLRNERRLLELNKVGIDVQRDVFLFNTNLTLKQQNSEIQKILELINTDREIIVIRQRIKEVTKNQLEFGVASTNDYTTAANALDLAAQNLILHKIQLLQAQYNFQFTSGN
ncbi:TolC family protein [Nemorincola caseinilytica]|uniref:TolC family protein n=1 Tax=Nemorincola caseinilytica TaxID=2054315 RepID=A0ABP8NN41_9BACT